MRYRPRSSVTTVRENFVGRPVVSAITQTPASGPFGPVTTPPMSSPSMATSPPAPWVADTPSTVRGASDVNASRAVQAPVSSRKVRRVRMRLLVLVGDAGMLAESPPAGNAETAYGRDAIGQRGRPSAFVPPSSWSASDGAEALRPAGAAGPPAESPQIRHSSPVAAAPGTRHGTCSALRPKATRAEGPPRSTRHAVGDSHASNASGTARRMECAPAAGLGRGSGSAERGQRQSSRAGVPDLFTRDRNG